MNESQQTMPRRRRWWRIPAGIGAAVFLLVVLALGATQTGWFRSKVRQAVERSASDALNARLTIRTLRGSLFTSFQLESIALVQGMDTVMTVERIRARYAFRPLLSRRLLLDTLSVSRPVLNLRQLSDGSWNIARLGAPAGPPDTAAAEGGGLPVDVVAKHILLADGAIAVESPGGIIPEEIRDITLRAAALYTDSLGELSVAHFSFAARRPDFRLRRLSFAAVRNDSGTVVRNLSLRTANNELAAAARIPQADGKAATASVRADSVSLEEFDFFLGEFRLGVAPDITAGVELKHDTLHASIGLRAADQRIGIKAMVSGVGARESRPEGTGIGYVVHITADNVSPGEWLDAAGAAAKVNGTLELSGSGVSAETARLDCSGRFFDSTVLGYRVDSLLVSARYARGAADFRSRLHAPFGRSALSGRIRGIPGQPDYALEGTIRGFDLAVAAADTALKSDLNGRLSISGAGTGLDDLRADLSLDLSNSTMTGRRLDSLFVAAKILNREIELKTLALRTDGIDLAGHGRYALRDNSFAVRSDVRVDDPGIPGGALPFDKIRAAGRISIDAAGRPDSLAGNVESSLAHIVLDSIGVDSLSGSAGFEFVRGRPPSIASNWTAAGIRRADVRLDRLSANIALAGDSIAVHADLESGGRFRLRTESTALLSPLRITLRSLDIDYRHLSLRQIEAPAHIAIDSTGYRVDRFMLASAGGGRGPESRIAVHGAYALRGDHDLHVAGEAIDISQILSVLDTSLAVTGTLSFRVDVAGDAERPAPVASVKIHDGSARGIEFDSLSTRAAYAGDSLDVAARIDFSEYAPLSVSGFVPIHLPPKNGAGFLLTDKPLFLQLTVDSMPLGLARLYMRTPIAKISGFAACSLSVHNTIADPRFSGNATIKCDQLQIPQYGIQYRDIGLYLSLDGNRVALDSLLIRRERGSIAASGFADWRAGETVGKLESLSIDIRAEKFYLARHKDYELEITGGARAAVAADSARLGGDITVNRSRLYLPVVTGRSKSTAATDPDDVSMLVAATRPKPGTDAPLPEDAAAMTRKRAAFTANELYQRFRGTLTLRMPRNTWIVSPEMRMELEGSLDVVKKRPEPELFGSIRVVRGYYELYGRRFRIDEGELLFEGGSGVNPRLAIAARYQFRDPNRNQRQLVLAITGTAGAPELSFALDGAEISEGDAMAFILFGRSFDSLTSGQRGTVAKTGEDGGMASKIATGFLADQIEKKIGRTLELDVFEVKAQEDWGGGAFEVGKYLTSDLFVSYESGFGVTVDNEVVPRKVTLEYELTPSLFFRLIEGDTRTSGFDLIFRLKND